MYSSDDETVLFQEKKILSFLTELLDTFLVLCKADDLYLEIPEEPLTVFPSAWSANVYSLNGASL